MTDDLHRMAQDAVATLVEECRTGLLYRLVLANGHTSYIPHKFDTDMNVPCFYLGEHLNVLDYARLSTWFGEGFQLHLPYPRCAFLNRVSEGADSLVRGSALVGEVVLTGRWYLFLAEEIEDGALLIPFMRHDNHKHWSRQTWQVVVTHAGDMEIAMEPGAAGPKFLAGFRVSIEARVHAFLIDLHRILNTRGQVATCPGGPASDKIAMRRTKLALPPIQPIRIISWDMPETTHKGATGVPKRPHFRRGTWRTLQTGARTWVRPAAIHGGSGSNPPWYHVETGDKGQ